MSIAAEVTPGDLVAVSLTYDGDKTFTFYGHFTSVSDYAVKPLKWGVHSAAPEDAKREGIEEYISSWATVINVSGAPFPQLPRAKRFSGEAGLEEGFQAITADWLINSFNARVRIASPVVTIEPITEEGEAWISANLSTLQRLTRFEERLEELDSSLVQEFQDLLYLVREEARDEEARWIAQHERP